MCGKLVESLRTAEDHGSFETEKLMIAMWDKMDPKEYDSDTHTVT